MNVNSNTDVNVDTSVNADSSVNDSETFAYIESLTTENTLSCGALLVRAREAAGLSQKQLAEQLHLLPAVVKALEADNFAAIRSPLYCRGYLISYAKHLKLDVAEVLAQYERQCPKPEIEDNAVIKPALHTTFKPVAIPFSNVARRGYGKSFAVMLAVAGLVSVLFIVNNSFLTASIETSSALSTAADKPATMTTTVADIASLAGTEPAAPSAVATTALVLPGNEPFSIADAAGKQLAPADAPLKLEATTKPASQSATADDTLSLRFTDNCWIEIRDSNNVVIASGMYRANDVLNLSGKGPFKLHLGFAPGVNVALNGRAINVGQGDAVNHTARLVVGSS